MFNRFNVFIIFEYRDTFVEQDKTILYCKGVLTKYILILKIVYRIAEKLRNMHNTFPNLSQTIQKLRHVYLTRDKEKTNPVKYKL